MVENNIQQGNTMLDHNTTEPALKTIEVAIEGNTVFIERKDPYGFFYLRLAEGELPAKFKGAAYTTIERAHQGITLLKEHIEKSKALLEERPKKINRLKVIK